MNIGISAGGMHLSMNVVDYDGQKPVVGMPAPQLLQPTV